jgi:hypothetical protein
MDAFDLSELLGDGNDIMLDDLQIKIPEIEDIEEKEQALIDKYHLHKIEAFYLFNGSDGEIKNRLNEIFAFRGQPFFIP